MLLTLKPCVIRSWRAADVKSLAGHANSRNIWMSVRDRFPHPYLPRDARAFIARARAQRPETSFAIAVGDEPIGGIGFQLQTDVERVSAEIGYWVGEVFWGRGIATEAVLALTTYAIETHGLTRLYALPFAGN